MRKKLIVREMVNHAPFTMLGAITGIALILALRTVGRLEHEIVFHSLHFIHLFFSAVVTTAVFAKYEQNRVKAAIIGFSGAILICPLSDILFPYVGGHLLGIRIHFHLCLVEHPYLPLLSTLLGVLLGTKSPSTRIPHFIHVLISTYASTFYFTAFGFPVSWIPYLFPLTIVLFLAVWLPCCVSDIVFPLFFVTEEE